MKKSEMLGKIWTLLYLETDLNEESLKDLALMILKEVEDNDMQPPKHPTKGWPIVTVNPTGTHDYGTKVVYEWEEE